MSVTLVTGSSTGIGFETSLHLARQGFRVYATMRSLAKADSLREVAQRENLSLDILALDVTDAAARERVISEIVEREGVLDVLVNNAGVGGATPLELTPEAEHREIFETNYFGIMELTRLVLPAMRERRSGTIVNVSSITGRIATPNQAAYSASKWALEAASEALAHEVFSFGLRVALIEPGIIMTEIFNNSAPRTRYDRASPYRQIMRRNGKMYEAGFRRNIPARAVAEAIHEAITTDQPKLRYPVGADAETLIPGRASITDEEWIAMGGDLPDAEYNSRFKRYFGIELP